MIMDTKRIKEIQETTAYPKSLSVMLALKQVWNECEQNSKNYTEEEVLNLLKKYKIESGSNEDACCFFEQFKK